MIRPLDEYVVLRPQDPPVTTGGILIPDVARDDTANRNDYIHEWNRFCLGEVLAVGPGPRKQDAKGRYQQGRVPIDLERGQVVSYKRAEAVDLPAEVAGEPGLVMVRAASIAFEVPQGA